MSNQQGVPEALPDPSPDQLRAIARTARNSSGSASDDCGPLAYVLYGWRAAAIVFRAQRVTTHVQNPAEIEHVAGDVLKNGAKPNMAQQFAPSAVAGIPGNFITHRAAWRNALETAKAHATGDGLSYWAHEIAAFDRSFDRLWALMQPSPTPQADSQPAPVETACWACNSTGLVTTSSNGSGLIDEKCQACSAGRTPADGVLEDAARLDWLQANSCDLRCIDVPTGGDDYDINWVVIEHYEANPHEREIGRSYQDDPRAAIDAARKQGANNGQE